MCEIMKSNFGKSNKKNIKNEISMKQHGLTCCLGQRALSGGKCLSSVIPETCLFDLPVTCTVPFSYTF